MLFSQQKQSGRVSLLLDRTTVQLPETETAVLQAGEHVRRVSSPGEGQDLPGASPVRAKPQAEAQPGNVLIGTLTTHTLHQELSPPSYIQHVLSNNVCKNVVINFIKVVFNIGTQTGDCITQLG